LLVGLTSPDPSTAVGESAKGGDAAIAIAAPVVVKRLPDLSPSAFAVVESMAMKRPDHWLESVRAATAPGRLRPRAAVLLEQIGEAEDVSRLRAIARTVRDPSGGQLGRGLARRLATRVFIEDLGRLRVVMGSRIVEGAAIRRKVLALLAFLLTRPRWSATREEVVDNLWPDLDPQAALNSLNQTVYFLRRVFEPSYKEVTSPGYVEQDGEAIWLDPELIEARSGRCLGLIRNTGSEPDAEVSLRLAREYRGRFAEDFLYEDWASPFRDALHAAYLRVVEAAIRLDIDTGNYSRGVFLAERANEVEPDSEELQLGLIRIYRLAGARAAAAEQYAHYSKAMRDLGVDPLPLADV
jgi:DNA-binding SARP family transcriptional activator